MTGRRGKGQTAPDLQAQLVFQLKICNEDSFETNKNDLGAAIRLSDWTLARKIPRRAAYRESRGAARKEPPLTPVEAGTFWFDGCIRMAGSRIWLSAGQLDLASCAPLPHSEV